MIALACCLAYMLGMGVFCFVGGLFWPTFIREELGPLVILWPAITVVAGIFAFCRLGFVAGRLLGGREKIATNSTDINW